MPWLRAGWSLARRPRCQRWFWREFRPGARPCPQRALGSEIKHTGSGPARATAGQPAGLYLRFLPQVRRAGGPGRVFPASRRGRGGSGRRGTAGWARAGWPPAPSAVPPAPPPLGRTSPPSVPSRLPAECHSAPGRCSGARGGLTAACRALRTEGRPDAARRTASPSTGSRLPAGRGQGSRRPATRSWRTSEFPEMLTGGRQGSVGPANGGPGGRQRPQVSQARSTAAPPGPQPAWFSAPALGFPRLAHGEGQARGSTFPASPEADPRPGVPGNTHGRARGGGR